MEEEIWAGEKRFDYLEKERSRFIENAMRHQENIVKIKKKN